MEKLLSENHSTLQYQKKLSIVRIRRQCCAFLPNVRNCRILYYLFLIFFGIFVLYSSHTKLSSIENFSRNSASRISCKVLPGQRGCSPVEVSYYPVLSEENVSDVLEEKYLLNYKVESEPPIKTLTFAPIANFLNFIRKPKITKHNKPGNVMISEKDKKIKELIHSTDNSLSNTAKSVSEINQSNDNTMAVLKHYIDAALGAMVQTKPKDVEKTKMYTTNEPITSSDVSTQIPKPNINHIFSKHLLQTTKYSQISHDSKMHDVLHPIGDISNRKKPLSLDEIRQRTSDINLLHTVYNSDLFGPLTNDSIIILIQVHNRLDNLRELIKSLEKAQGISSTLLVFSHDYYDEDIINLVMGIKFAKFIVIFFPYSIQLHPNDFPGLTEDDCPWNVTQNEAEEQKCNMYQHPDHFGHYRQGHITQIKHHWWWKANKVFDYLEYTKHHNGFFLFLEEDFYVTEDMLHVLNLMKKKKNEVCINYCNILFLGSHTEKDPFNNWIPNQVEIHSWNSLGFAFNRIMWEQLKDCLEEFCTFDDYNWDWSLRYVAQNCFKNKLAVLAVKGARVFHTGDCGIHHHDSASCEIEGSMTRINNFMKKVSHKLFPKELDFVSSYEVPLTITKGWGGWADPRDQNLCIEMVNHVIK